MQFLVRWIATLLILSPMCSYAFGMEKFSGSRAQLQELIDNSKIPVVVEFGAEWCGYCKMEQREITTNFEPRLSGQVRFIHIDTDENPELGKPYGTDSGIPVTVAFRHSGLDVQSSQIQGYTLAWLNTIVQYALGPNGEKWAKTSSSALAAGEGEYDGYRQKLTFYKEKVSELRALQKTNASVSDKKKSPKFSAYDAQISEDLEKLEALIQGLGAKIDSEEKSIQDKDSWIRRGALALGIDLQKRNRSELRNTLNLVHRYVYYIEDNLMKDSMDCARTEDPVAFAKVQDQFDEVFDVLVKAGYITSEDLFAQAQAMIKNPSDSDAVDELLWKAELATIRPAIPPEDVKKAKKAWEELVFLAKTDLDTLHPPEDVDEMFYRLARLVRRENKHAKGYVRSSANLFDYLLGKGANCEGETKVFIALATRLGLQTKPGEYLGMQVYKDHLQPTIFNKNANSAWIPTLSIFQKKLDAPIYRKQLFAHAFLKGAGEHPAVDAKSLRLDSTQFADSMELPRLYETSTTFSYPGGNKNFSKGPIPEEAEQSEPKRRAEAEKASGDNNGSASGEAGSSQSVNGNASNKNAEASASGVANGQAGKDNSKGNQQAGINVPDRNMRRPEYFFQDELFPELSPEIKRIYDTEKLWGVDEAYIKKSLDEYGVYCCRIEFQTKSAGSFPSSHIPVFKDKQALARYLTPLGALDKEKIVRQQIRALSEYTKTPSLKNVDGILKDSHDLEKLDHDLSAFFLERMGLQDYSGYSLELPEYEWFGPAFRHKASSMSNQVYISNGLLYENVRDAKSGEGGTKLPEKTDLAEAKGYRDFMAKLVDFEQYATNNPTDLLNRFKGLELQQSEHYGKAINSFCGHCFEKALPLLYIKDSQPSPQPQKQASDAKIESQDQSKNGKKPYKIKLISTPPSSASHLPKNTSPVGVDSETFFRSAYAMAAWNYNIGFFSSVPYWKTNIIDLENAFADLVEKNPYYIRKSGLSVVLFGLVRSGKQDYFTWTQKSCNNVGNLPPSYQRVLKIYWNAFQGGKSEQMLDNFDYVHSKTHLFNIPDPRNGDEVGPKN